MIKKTILMLLAILILPYFSYASLDCNEGLKFFDGSCYDCNGILYKQADNKVICINCAEGYEYNLQGGCRPKEIPQERDVGSILDKLSSRISPENPILGFILILIFLILISRYIYKKWL